MAAAVRQSRYRGRPNACSPTCAMGRALQQSKLIALSPAIHLCNDTDLMLH
jgi:hypothetical protein